MPIVLVVVWQVSTSVFSVPAYLVPSPISVLNVLLEHPALFAAATLVTMREVAGGLALAIILALPLALCISYSRSFENLVNPLIIISQALPKIAIAPLLLVWFGFGEMPKILMAALIAFFPMLISAVTGFKSIEPEVLGLIRSMGASVWRSFWKIRVPTAMPNIMAGLKLAITFALIGAILGEFISGDKGLGYLIQSASGAQRTDVVFAGLLVISFVSLILFYGVEAAERRMIFWHQSQIAVAT
jgi:NitT/TauT family transport system permease protein